MRHILLAIALCACGGESFEGTEPEPLGTAGAGAAGGSGGSAGTAGGATGGKSGGATGGVAGSVAGTGGASGTGGSAGTGTAGISGSAGTGGTGTVTDAGADAADACPGPSEWDGEVPDAPNNTPCESWMCGWMDPQGHKCQGAPCCKTAWLCGHDWGDGCE